MRLTNNSINKNLLIARKMLGGVGQDVQKSILNIGDGGDFLYKMTKWGKVNNLTVAKMENVWYDSSAAMFRWGLYA